MAQSATTSVEIDTELLARLRERWPEKPDRQLIEDLVLIQLGFAALRSSQQRNGLSEEEAVKLGVRAVHEARQAQS
ncbi:MAG: hypothetical protein ACRDK5_11910 [Solirubrobacterales bacterium]